MERLTRYGFPALAIALGIAAVPLGSSGPPGAGLFAGLGAALLICASVIAYSARLGAAVTAVAMIAANGYLLRDKWFPSEGGALCSVSEVINCSAVNASEYSELMGVPVTLLGVAFYAGLLLAALGGPKTTPRFHQVNGIFAVLSLAFSAYLANASASLGLVCPFCISIYVGNALLLWAAIRGMRQNGQQLMADVGGLLQTRSFATVVGAFVLIAAVGGSSWKGRSATAENAIASAADPSAMLSRYFAKAPGPIELDGSEPVLGDPNAPYVVVEFADFACGHCAHAAKELKQLVAEYPSVQVRFKVFPLTGECNPGLPERGAERCIAAAAAECAHQQGKFWELSANIFRNQQYMSMDDLAFMARDEGLDIGRWQACLSEPATGAGILADATAGQRAGVMGTPAIYLKGTHGDEFVLITHGVDALLQVVKAHQKGIPFPAPGPPPPPQH